MSRIRVLPPELADQIAAGEVVERPASVVKELCENALDAGARKIEVEIERGGLSRVVVSDDGSGMTPEEAALALKRHATSKLTAIEDLFTLASMGFRGEALPSIAAVSRLTLTTRSRAAAGDEGAWSIEVRGGVAEPGRLVGAPVGTRVVVEELLGNVPARLKFLKGEVTESAHVAEAVLRLSLAFPSVHFRLRSDGRMTHDLPPHQAGLLRAKVALGRARTPARLHLGARQENGIAVEAYLGSPADSANTSRGTYLYVNRRFVRDRSLLHSVLLGYGETLERGRYPLAVVHVAVPGRSVDINVHPQKLEVRFAEAPAVYAAVRHCVAAAVADAPWLGDEPRALDARHRGHSLSVATLPPSGSGSPTLPGRFAREPQPGYAERRSRAEAAMQLWAPSTEPLFTEPAAARPPDEDAPAGFFASLLFLGQLHRTYLLCQAPGELVLIDQHAAHERVAFERLKHAQGKRAPRGQRLLLPVTVELSADLMAAAREHQALLVALGFELLPFGATTLAVHALPEALASADPALIVPDVLGELAAHQSTELVEDKIDHVLSTLACHSVARAGDVLGEREARALFLSMDGIDYRANCPHGRPVLLRMSLAEIERRFGRS